MKTENQSISHKRFGFIHFHIHHNQDAYKLASIYHPDFPGHSQWDISLSHQNPNSDFWLQYFFHTLPYVHLITQLL